MPRLCHQFVVPCAAVLLLVFLPSCLLTTTTKTVASVNNKSRGSVAGSLLNDDENFIFLTFANGANDSNLVVNLVLANGSNGNKTQLSLQSNNNGQHTDFHMYYMVLQDGPDLIRVKKVSNKTLPLLSAESAITGGNGSFEYSIEGITNGWIQTRPLPTHAMNADYELRVCVFGDFTQNLYEWMDLNLSAIIEAEQCQMNLFIGKSAWERVASTRRFNFSPYIMLHSIQNASRHRAFAQVPSLFGAIDGNLTETGYFQCDEVGDVAFIQIATDIGTYLRYGTKAFDMIDRYYRETMFNELECKLQELHRRAKRPWIVLYVTHPYVTNGEEGVQWFLVNQTDIDRFFDILKRYKVDLLTSCGIEGMGKMLADARVRMPEAKLPEYVQTTVAQCGGYASADVSLQNECTYAVLDIRPQVMRYVKKNAEQKNSKITNGNASGKENNNSNEGEIQRTFEVADQCVPNDEL